MIHKKIGSMCLTLLLVAIGLALTGCDTGVVAVTTKEAAIAPTWEAYLKNHVVPDGNGFVIEGDIPASSLAEVKRYYDEYVSAGAGALARSTVLTFTDAEGNRHRGIWTPQEAVNLTYCVGGFNATEKQMLTHLLNLAARSWGDAANVRFIHKGEEDVNASNTNNNVVFNIRKGDELLSENARAFAPYDLSGTKTPRAQRELIIRPIFFADETAPWRLHIVRHELGHILGLRHEHIWFDFTAHLFPHTQETTGGAEQITSKDSASIMFDSFHAQTPVYTGNKDLSSADKVGISAIYGAPPPTTTTTTVWIQTPISMVYDNGSTSNGSYSASTGTAMVVATSGSMSAIVNYPFNRSAYRISGYIQVLGAGQNGSITVGGVTIANATTAPQAAQWFSYPWTGNQQVKINSVYPSGTGVCKVTNLIFSSSLGTAETLTPQIYFPIGNTIQGYYASGTTPGSYTVLNMVTQGSSTVTFTLPQRSTYIVVGDLSLTMPSDQTNGIFTAGGRAIYATSTPQKVAFEWSGSNIATLAMSGIGSGAVRLQNVTFYAR